MQQARHPTAIKLLFAVGVVAITAGGVLMLVQRSQADLGGETAFQRDILKDGRVEHSEYLASVEATRDCVSAAGVQVGEIRDLAGRIDFEYGGAGTLEGANAQQAIFASCLARFGEDVQYAWTVQHAPAAAESERKRAGLAACLAKLGYALPALPTNEQFQEIAVKAPRDFGPCARQFADERGILEF